MVRSYASALQINANEWNHVSVSINKNTNTVKFTKDHLEETFTGADFTPINNNSSNIFIGYNEEKINSFKGDIDNVSIYSNYVDKVKLEIKEGTFPVLDLKNIESDTTDASGFGSTSTFVNTNVTNTTNQMEEMNNAFDFNGTDSKVLVDNINYDGYKNINITLSTWVNPSITNFSSVLNNMPILSKDLISGNLEFGITSDGKIYSSHFAEEEEDPPTPPPRIGWILLERSATLYDGNPFISGSYGVEEVGNFSRLLEFDEERDDYSQGNIFTPLEGVPSYLFRQVNFSNESDKSDLLRNNKPDDGGDGYWQWTQTSHPNKVTAGTVDGVLNKSYDARLNEMYGSYIEGALLGLSLPPIDNYKNIHENVRYSTDTEKNVWGGTQHNEYAQGVQFYGVGRNLSLMTELYVWSGPKPTTLPIGIQYTPSP